ncbi:tetraacyldisaccharide 4'-kinase [Oceanicoccus sp. KOV_DT_Chl]|uniref:tetraacyldisaccharide 4'-kinase n=1 Tax=Oceanicoccus sp. KOV_DT_Chl TaxID=1904639 RepID=UPI00190E8DEF|nr:tetraacyldisaccharide 4'-kinase [Oceanicoccus sp. KOV_DT_Chl]
MRGFANQLLLPAGPLRESLARLTTVNHVVCNGRPVPLPAAVSSSVMRLIPASLHALNGDTTIAANEWSGNKQVHAIAGIGNPQRFFTSLKQLDFDPTEHCFADHHPFVETDLQFDDDLAIIMTEKDAVKIRCLPRTSNSWYLPVSANIEGELLTDVVATLKRLAAVNKEPE